MVSAKKILIATGASILDTGIKIPENVNYLLPESIIDLARPPRSIFIVGAGSTGCEMAQYLATLGTEVVVAEIAGRLLPREDEEVGQTLEEVFHKDKIKILTQTRVIALEKDLQGKKVIFLRGGQEKYIHVDEVLLCTGNAARCDIGLENAGIAFSRNGIEVNSSMQTSDKNIYAVGDVIGGHSTLEKARLEARTAVEHMFKNSKATINYAGLTRITNTWPQIAQLGETEDDCIRKDAKICKVVVPLHDVVKSSLSGETDGFIKLICNKKNKNIIGATIMAPNAGLIAQELAVAIRYSMSTFELMHVPHLENDWNALIQRACEQI